MKLFDWFRSSSRQDAPTEEWWERLDRLESEMKQLQLEWEETFGRVRRALASLAKRQQRESAEETGEAPAADAPRAPASADPSAYAQLRAMYGRR